MEGLQSGRAIHLEAVPLLGKSPLQRLMTDYLLEFASMEGVTPERDADGQVLYPYFDAYWGEHGRYPFVLCLGRQTIGFCLLRDTGSEWQIAEFYVAPAFRRTGRGKEAVSLLKAYCRKDPRHRYLHARTHSYNHIAQAFWRSQGFVTVSDSRGEQDNRFDLHAESARTSV